MLCTGSEPQMKVEAYIYDALDVTNLRSPQRVAGDEITGTIQDFPLTREGDRGFLFNVAGDTLLSTLQSLQDQVQTLQSDIRALQDKVQTSEKTVQDNMQTLKADHEALKVSHRRLLARFDQQRGARRTTPEDPRVMRSRLIAKYCKREGLAYNTDHVKDGDKTAHGPNCLTDAHLFSQERHNDAAIYERIYGVSYQKVLDYQSRNADDRIYFVFDAIGKLNLDGHAIHPEIDGAFRAFLQEVEKSQHQPPHQACSMPLDDARKIFVDVYCRNYPKDRGCIL